MNSQNMMLMLLLADRLGADKPAAAATGATPAAPPPDKKHLLNAVLLASAPRAFAPVAALVVYRNAEAADTAEAKAIKEELTALGVDEKKLGEKPAPVIKAMFARAGISAAAGVKA